MADESEASYTEVFRKLKKRGMCTPRLVISDAHNGLVSAIRREFTRASWQRCKVHFMRSILVHIPQKDKERFAAELKSLSPILCNRPQATPQNRHKFGVSWHVILTVSHQHIETITAPEPDVNNVRLGIFIFGCFSPIPASFPRSIWTVERVSFPSRRGVLSIFSLYLS